MQLIPPQANLKIKEKTIETIIIMVFFIAIFSTPHFSLIENSFNPIDRGHIEGNPDDISKTIPKTSSNYNGDDIEAIFERKLDDYTNLAKIFNKTII